MTVEVRHWPEVREDLRSLPSNALRLLAIGLLFDLERDPFLGLPLRNHLVLGDLSDCRKLSFDETRKTHKRWRIIYRLLPDERQPEVAEVIIVGPRADERVYHDVMMRLGRASGA